MVRQNRLDRFGELIKDWRVGKGKGRKSVRRMKDEFSFTLRMRGGWTKSSHMLKTEVGRRGVGGHGLAQKKTMEDQMGRVLERDDLFILTGGKGTHPPRGL